jgi:hypothetical protein
MKVESMPVQACKSTTRQVSPAAIRSRLNAFSAGLFKNEPFPSQRIQLNPSKIPTKIGHSVVTEKNRHLNGKRWLNVKSESPMVNHPSENSATYRQR